MDMHPVGLDALVFITNTDNPVDSLTIDQIRGIFSGEITNWKEVGGLDAPITAFQRPELSGSQTLMLNLCMGEVPMAPVEQIVVSNTMEDVINDIAAYDNSANAIGYSVYYYAKNMYTFPNLKFITVDGVTPTNETINSGEYPFINPFYAILPKENAKPMAQKMVAWLESYEGQVFVSQCGYVPYMKGVISD
jgi:ABC-type phosphate transport system substrate-binding protein